MSENTQPIVIKRYASRRLYNTVTSEYLSLREVAELIRQGNDVQILDRKSGDDLTRQYLLQIITEHESRGDNVLPVNILTDIVRSYGGAVGSIIPDFLARSYEMLKSRKVNVIKKLSKSIPSALNPLSVFGDPVDWQEKQSDLLNTLIKPFAQKSNEEKVEAYKEEIVKTELETIKGQLAEMQEKLSKM